VLPYCATWAGSVLAQAVVALRTALDNIRLAIGCLTDDEVLTMTRPQRRARMCVKHSRVRRIAEIRLRSTAAYQSASVSVSKVPGFGPPALLNTMMIALNGSMVCFTSRSSSVDLVTFAAKA